MEAAQLFTQKLLALFEMEGRRRTVAKGALLIREGAVEQHLYLVHNGALRVCYLNGDEEHTIRFGYAGSMLNSLASFIGQRPSEFYIEAIRKTELTQLSRAQVLALAFEDMASQEQYIALLEGLIVQLIDRETDLLISAPQQRLNRVLERSPALFQHVPLKYIAAYLRMQPETLSRLRKS